MIMSDARLIAPILATFIALAGIYLSISMGMTAWVIVIIAMVGCFLLGFPRRLLALYFGWLTIAEMMEALFGRMIFVIWLDELLTLLLMCVVLVTRIETGKQLREYKFFARVLMVLGFLCVISFAANRVPLRGAVHFALAYFRFFLIFYYVRRFMSESMPRWFLTAFGVIFGFQVLLNFGWLVGLNPLPNHALMDTSVDFAYGSWLGVPTVAYMSIAVACLSIAWFNMSQGLWRRVFAGLVGIIAVAQLWITYTVHAYMLLIVCTGTQIMLLSRRTGQKIFIGFVTLVLVLVCIRPVERMIEHKRLRLGEQLTAQNIRARLTGMLEGTKARAYKDVIVTVPREHLRFPLLGAGPGNFASAMGRLYRRPLAERYINYVITVKSYREYVELSEGGSITGMPYSGVLALWGDMGPLGAVFYLAPFFYTLLHVLKVYRSRQYTHKFQHALAEALIVIMPMFIFLNFLTDYFHNAFLQGGVWAWAAVVWDPIKKNEAGTVEEGSAEPLSK